MNVLHGLSFDENVQVIIFKILVKKEIMCGRLGVPILYLIVVRILRKYILYYCKVSLVFYEKHAFLSSYITVSQVNSKKVRSKSNYRVKHLRFCSDTL